MDDDALVAAIYATATEDGMLETVLAALAERFRCSTATLAYFDPAHPEADIVAAHGVSARPDVQEAYRLRFAESDPAPAAFSRLAVGEVSTTARMFDAAAAASSPFLRDFYHPIGLREAMGGPFVNDHGRFGLLALQRGEEREAFTDGDCALLARFSLHLKQAMSLRDAFFRQETLAATLGAVLDDTVNAILVCDRQARIVHANAEARRMLSRGDALSLDRGGHLHLADATADAALRALLGSPPGSTPPKVLRVPRDEGRLPYLLCAKPIRSAGRTGAWSVSLFISRPDRRAGDVAAALRAALLLSEPSARLTAALLDGQTLALYSRRAGISQNTVKFHLKGAFEATGSRRQADLVRVAAAVVRDLGLSDPIG